MIVKKVKTTLRKEKKPKAWQIKDLVDYIRHPHNVNPEEKVEYSGSRNFLSNTHAGQRAEMIGLAHETVHSKMPVQHWIFSWKEGEQPTEQQVEEFVDIFLEKMGLQGHQTVFGLHNNTENFHLHIAVNRVNPDTLKVIQPHKGFDIKAAHRILAIAENKQGWESEKNALYAVLENGEIVERLRKKEIKPQQPALDFEHARGEKSAQRMAQERGHEIIKSAGSWKELHENLENVGLRFEKKGSGAIIFVGDIAVKASSVDRKFSMKKLVDRLGKFEAGNYQADNPVTQPEPISAINREEWIKYKKEEAEYKSNKEDRKKSIKDLKQNHISQRKKALAGLAKHGLNILNIGRHFLKHHQKSEINQLTLKNKKKYSLNNFPRFETWLRQHGKFKQADMWRYRKSFENENNVHVQEEIQENNSMRQRENFERYAQAVAADRYRVTCIKMEEDGKGKKTFILDKKDGVTKGFTVDELKRKMPEMLRLQARGENIYYTPLSERKHHILIDDMSKDSVNKLMQGGFQPAALLESSPGNYQCLLTIPKLGTEFDKDVGNRLTEQLNRMYGDPKL